MGRRIICPLYSVATSMQYLSAGVITLAGGGGIASPIGDGCGGIFRLVGWAEDAITCYCFC